MADKQSSYIPDREVYLEVLGLMAFWRNRDMRAQLGNPTWDIDVSHLPALFAASVQMLNTFADITAESLGIDRERFLKDTALGLAAWDDEAPA